MITTRKLFLTAIPVLAMALLLVVAGCGGNSDKTDKRAQESIPVRPPSSPAPGGARWKAKKKTPQVVAEKAKQQAIARMLELTGNVTATNTVTVRATLDGPLAFCPWREGDTVKRGEKLVGIERALYREDVRTAEAALAVARAKLADLKAGARPEELSQAAESVKELEECREFAQNDLKRIEKLVASGSLSGESLEKARVTYVKCRTQLVAAKDKLQMLKSGPTATEIAVQEALVKEAQAKVSKAKAILAECTLTAPFDAVVTEVHVRPGDLATAKAPLVSLMQKGSLVVQFGVPESAAATIAKNTAATLRFDALPGKEFNSRVERVYPELDTATRTRLVEAAIPAEANVAPGMFARVAVVAESAEAATVVPDSAVLTNQRGKPVVFVVVDGKVEQRNVKIGIESGRLVQILAGVEPGDVVAVRGHGKLGDGAAVRIAGKKTGAKKPTAGAGDAASGKEGNTK